MKSPTPILQWLASLLGAVTFFSAVSACTKPAGSCAGVQSGSRLAADTSGCVEIPTPVPTGTPTNPPVGVVDDTAGFYMRYVSSSKYTYDVHKGDPLLNGEGGYGTACTAAAGESIDCYMEAEELDLYFHGVTLQYNVPSTMCKYVRWTPFYYYQYPVDWGPTSVFQHTDKNGRVGYDADGDGDVESSEIVGKDKCVDLGGMIGVACTGCPYDYTTTGGPNCCQGDYVLETKTYDATLSKYNTVTTFNSWPGKMGNCFGGPATQTQGKNDDGKPMADLYFVENTGLNQTYPIKAPIEQGFGRNIFVANFFKSSPAPVSLDVQTSIYGPAYDLEAPETTYYLQCLDRAKENIATIRMHIREWNTESAFAARATSPANYDVTGAEPAPFTGDGLNDYVDWDNIPVSYPRKGQ